MDDSRFPVDCTLHDYLRQQADLFQKRRGPRPKSGAPGRAGDEPPLPLVPADRLFFLSPLSSATAPRSQAGIVSFSTGNVGQAFYRAFNAVWARIPEADRQRLLRYWQSAPDERARPGPVRAQHPRPLIRVVDGGRWSSSFPTCDHLGHRLTFPAALVTGHRELLPSVIARTLALVLRYATRAHWELYLVTVEEPMERWEARHGTKSADADRDAQVVRLEKAYLGKYEADLTRILHGWGFEPTNVPVGE